MINRFFMSFKSEGQLNSITLNSRDSDIWELVPVGDEVQGIFNGREVVVYGFQNCYYAKIGDYLASKIGKERVYDCYLGYSFSKEYRFFTLDNRKIEVLSGDYCQFAMCKNTLTNIVLENFKRNYLGLELISLLFVVQNDEFINYFTPKEIIKKNDKDEYSSDEEGEYENFEYHKYYTNSELRRLYKLCNEVNNPVLQEIANKTVCFAKLTLVDADTKKYEISRVEDPFWNAQEWIDLWANYTKNNQSKDQCLNRDHWHSKLLEKAGSFEDRIFKIQNDEWVNNNWPNHLLHIDCYLQHGLELEMLKKTPKKVQEVIINNIGSFVSIVAADGYSNTSFKEEIKNIPQKINRLVSNRSQNYWYNKIFNSLINKASKKILLELVEEFNTSTSNPIELKYPSFNSNLDVSGVDEFLLQKFDNDYNKSFCGYAQSFMSHLFQELNISEDDKQQFVKSMNNKLNTLHSYLYPDMKKIVLTHRKDVEKLLAMKKSFLDANSVEMDVQALFEQKPKVLKKLFKVMYLYLNNKALPEKAFFSRFMKLILDIPGFISFTPLTAVNDDVMDTSD